MIPIGEPNSPQQEKYLDEQLENAKRAERIRRKQRELNELARKFYS